MRKWVLQMWRTWWGAADQSVYTLPNEERQELKAAAIGAVDGLLTFSRNAAAASMALAANSVKVAIESRAAGMSTTGAEEVSSAMSVLIDCEGSILLGYACVLASPALCQRVGTLRRVGVPNRVIAGVFDVKMAASDDVTWFCLIGSSLLLFWLFTMRGIPCLEAAVMANIVVLLPFAAGRRRLRNLIRDGRAELRASRSTPATTASSEASGPVVAP